MKKALWILLFALFTVSVYSQNANCDSLISIYNEGKSGISDATAFCRGVEIANATVGLAIRGLGDPGHLSQCDFRSYSTYGVQVILTGDIVLPGQEDENAGFNSVMIPRIKDSLGVKFDLLGKLDSAWLDLGDQEFMFAMSGIFDFEEITDSTVRLIINPEKEQSSIFKSLDGIQFSDHSKNWVSRDSLLIGTTFKRSQRGLVYLMLNFNQYPNENNICQASGIYVFPIKIE